MANGITVEIKGLDEIKKALAALPDEIQKKVLDKAVREGVVDWQKVAAASAPVHGKVHVTGSKGKRYIVTPGNLRRSIQVRKLKTPNPKESRYGIRIRSRAFYWKFVEFGSRNNQRVPFLRNTFDTRAMPAINNIASARVNALAKSYLKR